MAEAWHIADPLSVEAAHEVLEITRHTASIVELWLVPRGDRLQYLSGEYVLLEDDPTVTAPALFLAARSGLAPIRALLEASLVSARRRSLSLIFSASTEARMQDRDRDD